MALNFPNPATSQVYFDPVSGLKYLWNSSIGAWETAIQPPAIIGTSAPDLSLEGFLWWDADDSVAGGRLKVYYQGNWVDATPVPVIGQTAATSSTAPANPNNGDLWWNDENGRLYIYYTDPGDSTNAASAQWVDASPESRNPNDEREPVTTSSGPPSDPVPNDLWFNSLNGNLYIYYIDPSSSDGLWVSVVDYGQSVEASGLSSLVGSGAINIAGTLRDPIISIRSATTTQTGVMRLANQTEAAAGTLSTVAISPALLKTNINSYVSQATETVSGLVELATAAEVSAGTDTSKAITPKALKDTLPSLAVTNPVGTVIEFASTSAPSGYLVCDGSLVSRTTYSSLFGVIGTNFGGGDGGTTFQLPTLTHANTLLRYCIKF
jgi:hypothetical protein